MTNVELFVIAILAVPGTVSVDRSIDLRKQARALAHKSAVLYILGHVLDLVTTFILSPDLERETNFMVDQLGFGWGYVLGAAAVSSVVVLVALRWMWPVMVQRFPAAPASYPDFYRGILYGDTPRRTLGRRFASTGFLIGIVCIAVYSAITTKLLTGFWNLLVLSIGIGGSQFLPLLPIKVGAAALVGLAMFFVYPYLLHRRACRRAVPRSGRRG